ncbi:MAG: hypothetical protein RJA59_1719 [Pseudomonadota bacterium]|jgi:hypothetical protein
MPRAASNSLTPDFLEEEVTVRGTTFKLRELSIGDYDELVKKATQKQTNPLSGEETETIDNSLLLKLMVLKCSFDPKLTPEALANLPMRVVLKLNQTVNRMHYGDEPAEEKKVEEGEPAKGED